MAFSELQMILGFIVILSIGVFLGNRISKKSTAGDSFLARVFQSNRDLDTTVGLIGINLIIIMMLISFHNAVKSDIGMIFLAAFNLYQSIVLGKSRENGSGHHEHKT